MNHKTIRAYQFKADEAVRTLEESGAQWVVGEFKPRWELNVQPKVDVEAIKKQARKEFLEEIMAIGKPVQEVLPVMVEVGQDETFQYGPQNRYEYQQHAGKKFKLTRIPSWHGLSTEGIEEGTLFTIEAAVKLQKRMYSGITVLFSHKGKQCWIPVTCIQVLQEV